MADILASGHPDGPGQRRRPPTWLLLLVAAAVLVGLQSWRNRALEPQAGPSPSPSAAATAEPSESRGPSGSPARFRLDGRPGAGPAGFRLEVGGTAPVIVDAHTGHVTPLPRLRRLVTGEFAELRRLPAATVIVVRNGALEPVATYVLPDAGGRVSVPPSDGVVGAVDGGLFAFDSGVDRPPGRLVSLTAAGGLRWQRPFSVPTVVQADTPYGLLIQELPAPPSTGGPLQLVDPRTGALRRELGRPAYVVTSTPNAVAWFSSYCVDVCQLTVTNVGTGRNTRYAMPDGRIPTYAAFSQDQRLLALSFPGLEDAAPGLKRDGFVLVLDLRSGQLETVPGLSTEARSAATPAWSPTEGLLALEVRSPPDGDHDRVVLWRPGEARLTELPLLPSGASGPVVLP